MPRGKKTQSLRKTAGVAIGQSRSPAAQPPLSEPLVLATSPVPAYISLTREDVEALARSSVALTDGIGAFGRELFDFQRQSLTAGLSTVRALIDARNLEEVVDLHGRYLRGSGESLVREGGRLAELANKIAGEAWRPLQDRAAAVALKLAKPAAG
jgi:phasin family protein